MIVVLFSFSVLELYDRCSVGSTDICRSPLGVKITARREFSPISQKKIVYNGFFTSWNS